MYSCNLDEFTYCLPESTLTYCLLTGGTESGFGDYSWVVTCANGTPSLELCGGGCGALDGQLFTCN